MKRQSPDAGRRRERRCGDAPTEVVPLYAAAVLAAATMMVATWIAPTSLLATGGAPVTNLCHPGLTDDAHEAERG